VLLQRINKASSNTSNKLRREQVNANEDRYAKIQGTARVLALLISIYENILI